MKSKWKEMKREGNEVILASHLNTQYPRNCIHFGWLHTSQFISNGNVQFQCRGWYALYVVKKKARVWKLGWWMRVKPVWLSCRRPEFASCHKALTFTSSWTITTVSPWQQRENFLNFWHWTLFFRIIQYQCQAIGLKYSWTVYSCFFLHVIQFTHVTIKLPAIKYHACLQAWYCLTVHGNIQHCSIKGQSIVFPVFISSNFKG